MQKGNEHFFKLVKQMREIESVIKMMDPSFKINRIAVRRIQPSGWFTVTRTCLGVLRQAGTVEIEIGRQLRRLLVESITPSCRLPLSQEE